MVQGRLSQKYLGTEVPENSIQSDLCSPASSSVKIWKKFKVEGIFSEKSKNLISHISNFTPVKDGKFSGKLTNAAKIIADSAKMSKYNKLLKKAQNQCGEFAENDQFCGICQDDKESHNLAIFFHEGEPEVGNHFFCWKCILQAMKAKGINLMEQGGECPLCRSVGTPIKIFNPYWFVTLFTNQ